MVVVPLWKPWCRDGLISLALQLCNPFCYLDPGGIQFLLYDCVHLILSGVVKGGCAGHEEEGGRHDAKRFDKAFQQLVSDELTSGLYDTEMVLGYVKLFRELFL